MLHVLIAAAAVFAALILLYWRFYRHILIRDEIDGISRRYAVDIPTLPVRLALTRDGPHWTLTAVECGKETAVITCSPGRRHATVRVTLRRGRIVGTFRIGKRHPAYPAVFGLVGLAPTPAPDPRWQPMILN